MTISKSNNICSDSAIRLFILITSCLVLLFSGRLQAQTTPKIQQLEKERKELHKKISESETLLKSTGKDVKSQLSNLALITGQIEERKRYLETLQKDAKSVELEIKRLENEMAVLDKELKQKRERYAHSLRMMRTNSSIQEKLMFILSAENFGQMYRRLRYVRQYAQFQRLRGEQVKETMRKVEEKKKTSQQAYKAKLTLLEQHEEEKKKLEAQETERRNLVASMQNKQIQIRNELNKQRQAADLLNAEIDRLIAIEIEAARKREEERRRKEAEERRKAEEHRKAEEKRLLAEAKRRSESSVNKNSRENTDNRNLVSGNKKEDNTASVTASAPVNTSKPEKMEAYNKDASDRRLSSVFERNKGRLPVPVTGPSVVVSRYGQYQVSGLRNVRLDNKGIDIRAKAGAMARVIFDGEVTAVFQYGGLANVLVRHGSYISVYCNLESVIVKQGSQLKTRDVIGQIHSDAEGNAVLHFQLRKETEKLNPEVWIGF